LKYNQPYGVSDPEAPYVNGNPSTGTMGSIPPAASIEHPQREIVNLILDAAAVEPNEGDLHQLGKSLQSGKITYGVDIGVVNALIVPVHPIPDDYYDGMQVRFKAKFAPTAATTLDAGRGARSLVKSGGAVLQGSEWAVGDHLTVTYDAASSHWQLPPSSYAMLYGARDYYVNAATGNDLNDGLTVGKPFQTLQKAQDTINLFNLNGYSVTVHVADGSYQGVWCGIINGTGTVSYIGNVATPSACIVSNSTGPAFGIAGTSYVIRGFKLLSSGNSGGQLSGNGVWCIGNGQCVIYEVEVGYCINFHFVADSGYICLVGPITVTATAGNAHMHALDGSYITSPWPNSTAINITAPINIASWAGCTTSSTMAVRYSPYNGAANVTGQKFNVSGNGVMNVFGNGVNYYPGNIAGVLSSGGQYV